MPLASRLVLLAVLAVCGLAAPARAQYFAFGQNRVRYESPEWRRVQTDHVDVYFYERDGRGASGYVLAAFAAEAAEDAYAETAALFGEGVTSRIPLVVYPTAAAFAVTNVADLPVGADGIGGVTEGFKNRIAVPFTGDLRQFRRVIHHEMVHAVLNALVYGGSVQALIRSGLRLRIPLWFNEGLAEYAALGWDTASDSYVRDALIDGALPPADRLAGYDAYRGGQAFWDFVAAEYGREKITEILGRLRVGRDVPGAIREATGLSVADLSDRWQAALRPVHFPEAAARDAVSEIARPLLTARRTGTLYNGRPVLSPLGDRVAVVAAREGTFDVLLAETTGDAAPRVLVAGQAAAAFESFRLASAGLAWSPDGRTLAVAVTSGPSDAIAFVDVATGTVRLVRPRGLDAVLALAWSPDGERLAAEATVGAQSDLFLIHPETGDAVNLTRDLYADHAPAWAPDGRSLVFHSDRGDALALGTDDTDAATAGRLDVRALGRTPTSLYRLTLATGTLARLTADPLADDTDAAVARDDTGRERVVFLSDRNGVANLYELEPGGVVRPLTDLVTGALGVSLSRDGRRAALLALDAGRPSVYFLRDPLTAGRGAGGDSTASGAVPAGPLAPTVWALRRSGGAPPPETPALAVASDRRLRENPFLRDAADARPPDARRRPRRLDPREAARLDSLVSALLARADSSRTARLDSLGRPGTGLAAPDSLAGLAFVIGPRPEPAGPPPPTDARDALGRLVPRRYRLRFTPDVVTAAGSYDTVYGVQSITQVRFSDVLGDWRVALATNLVLDLRNADYVLSLRALRGRRDVSLDGFHLARELPDFQNSTVFRYRNYGLVGAVRYPLSRTRRLDAEVGLLGVSLTDLAQLAEPARTRRFVVPRLTVTEDRTVFDRFGPRRGGRAAAGLAVAVGPDAFFGTVLGDARRYVPVAAVPGATLALRASAGLSVGPDPQRFYAAGVQTWLNPRLGSLPVEGPDDFVFATPVLPLRGFGFNEAAGDRFALANAEVRLPLLAALVPGTLPLPALTRLQATAFLDAGIIADGRIDVFQTPTDSAGAALPRVLDDLLLGAGAGLRTVVLGYPLHIDWAAPFDGRRFGDVRVYASVGLDF
ncbi:MAG TPA: peptidase S9 [Rubricoccaceae bacterium]|jgi:hypothetical protein